MNSVMFREPADPYKNNIFFISQLFAKSTMRNMDYIDIALKQIAKNRLEDPNYSAYLRLWEMILQHKEADALPTLETRVEIIENNVAQSAEKNAGDLLTTIDDFLGVVSSDPSGTFLKKFLMILSFYSRNYHLHTGFVVDGVMWKDNKISIVMSA